MPPRPRKRNTQAERNALQHKYNRSLIRLRIKSLELQLLESRIEELREASAAAPPAQELEDHRNMAVAAVNRPGEEEAEEEEGSLRADEERRAAALAEWKMDTDSESEVSITLSLNFPTRLLTLVLLVERQRLGQQ